MPTFAFSSEDDFRRAARAILRSEHTPQNRPGRRSRYPVAAGGGGSPRPYVITEDNGSGGNIAVYRSRGTTTGRKAQESETSCLFEAIDETSDEVELSLCFMSGVTFTGQVVLCQNISGTLCVTSSVSSHNLVGVSGESIAAGGTGDVRIDGTVGGSAVVEAENTLDFQVDAESTVYLMFDDSKQTFYIVAAEC